MNERLFIGDVIQFGPDQARVVGFGLCAAIAMIEILGGSTDGQIVVVDIWSLKKN